ncbi:MAG: hypothetical protein KUG75_08040 [Pseudomonadales bacterium]|nr:hypothetical protein [Pseudomonadales bacterium]
MTDTEKKEKRAVGESDRLEGVLTLDLVAIDVGAMVRLVGGETAIVVDNPRDGMWILLRYTESPDDPDLVGEEDLIFWADVLGVLGTDGEQA